jgi:glycosyltransferase involved in cell wall biosynthesis
LAQQYGISEHLILTGFRSDALAVIAACDILVVCNHHGVLGRPPLEAMAVGRPVVAWEGHSGRSSIVSEGETGLLAPRGDVPALGQLVFRLIEDADLREKMGKRGMQHAHQHFDPQCNARKVEHIYENVLNRKNTYGTRIGH